MTTWQKSNFDKVLNFVKVSKQTNKTSKVIFALKINLGGWNRIFESIFRIQKLIGKVTFFFWF